MDIRAEKIDIQNRLDKPNELGKISFKDLNPSNQNPSFLSDFMVSKHIFFINAVP